MKKYIFGGVVAASLLLVAVSAMAVDSTPKPSKTPVPVTDKIVCVGKAVTTREAALGSAIGSYNDAVKSAYAARASGLQQAYARTTVAEVKTMVGVAWTGYKLALKDASKAWRTARNAAWKQYTTDARACRAPGSISDSGRSGSEMSGQ